MNIHIERQKFLQQTSRRLCWKGKLAVFATCGALTWAWTTAVYPTEERSVYVTRPSPMCSIKDNINLNFDEVIPKPTKEIEHDREDSFWPWFVERCGFKPRTILEQKTTKSTPPQKKDLSPACAVPADVIKNHLVKVGLEESQVTDAIEKLQKKGCQVEISGVFNELLKANGGSVTVESGNRDYVLEGHSTTVTVSQKENNEYIYEIKTTFDGLVTTNPKRIGVKSLCHKIGSYIYVAVAGCTAIALFNSREIPVVCDFHSIGKISALTFLFASPFLYFSRIKYVKEVENTLSLDNTPDLTVLTSSDE